MTLKDLKGEVFVRGDGRIAGVIPPLEQPDAIPFEILTEHPATNVFPAWADVRVGKVLVRINPEICEPPWFRLFDCLMFAVEQAHKVQALEKDDKFQLELGGTKFMFWPEVISGKNIVMIDTLERITCFNSS